MPYTPDLKELASMQYDALFYDGAKLPKDFNEWYKNEFLPALYREIKKELSIS